MQRYRRRVLEAALQKYLKGFSVVGVTGPRQSGKSTLLQEELGDTYSYVTFDDFQLVELFQSDPERFFAQYQNRVIFDEVHRVPEIFSYIKLAVDRDRDNYGKFVLSSSSQFALQKQVSESLAGRMGMLSLLPFQFCEIPKALRSESMYRGGYPELINRNYEFFDEWFGAYLETYLDKDIRAVYQIGDMRDFRRFLILLAANVGQLLNLSRFSSDLGVAVNTVKRWISVLEASYAIFLLHPYNLKTTKRVVKSPKIYFWDTGLVSYLTGISSKEQFEKGPLAGNLFENYLISEIHKWKVHTCKRIEMSFLRTSSGDEIDLILETPEGKTFLEIKRSATLKSRMVNILEKYREGKGILLYLGEDRQIGTDLFAKNSLKFLEELTL